MPRLRVGAYLLHAFVLVETRSSIKCCGIQCEAQAPTPNLLHPPALLIEGPSAGWGGGRQQTGGRQPMTAADVEAERLAYRKQMDAEKAGKQVGRDVLMTALRPAHGLSLAEGRLEVIVCWWTRP